MAKLGTPPIVTVFGGGGFIGRYVCEALLKAGARIRVAERDPRRAFYLQPLGGVGQVTAVMADLRRPSTIDFAVDGADAVINLVGVFGGDLDQIHVEGARRAAAAAKEAGANAFVHISRTKALGEQAVRSAFSKATIIRPSTVFGPEDEFTNRFASMARFPVLPVIAPRTRFQPVYARDLGRAISAAALDPKAHGGKTYELAGPEVMTMRDLNEEVARMAGHNPEILDLPNFIASGIALFSAFIPGLPLTRDQWIMLQKDNVASGDAPGFKAFGMTPTPLAAVAPDWLGRYKSGGRFAPRAA
jgi:NADH dehydrogenase